MLRRRKSRDILFLAIFTITGLVIRAESRAAVDAFPPLPELRPEFPVAIGTANIVTTTELPPLVFEPDVTNAACGSALGNQPADFTPIEPIREAIVCGLPHPIRLESLTVDQVRLMPAATTNCDMAGALTNWLVQSVQPASQQYLGEPVAALRNVASYVCRSRNNVPGARLSEHATANALDVSAFQLTSGRWISVTEFWNSDGPESLFLKEIHNRACAEFTTVLGPEANANHLDHFHLDLGLHGRTGTYRVCE